MLTRREDKARPRWEFRFLNLANFGSGLPEYISLCFMCKIYGLALSRVTDIIDVYVEPTCIVFIHIWAFTSP